MKLEIITKTRFFFSGTRKEYYIKNEKNETLSFFGVAQMFLTKNEALKFIEENKDYNKLVFEKVN